MPLTLPIFPLGAVLLPGARLPLRLFEPRYLRLARDLMELPHDERTFGVVLIRAGHEVGQDAVRALHPVGCEARIDAIASAPGGPAGTIVQLVATGVRPFRLLGTPQARSTPYLTCAVEWRTEPTTEEDLAPLVSAANDSLAAYAALCGTSARAEDAPASQQAFRIAEAMRLPPSDLQRVLEGPSAQAQLRIVLELLARERALVGRFGALPHTPPPAFPNSN